MKFGSVMLDIDGTTLSDHDRALLKQPQVGGVILFTRNYESRQQISNLIADIRDASESSDLLISVDQEGGRVQRFRNDFTELPSLRTLGELYDQDTERAIDLSAKCALITAVELIDLGIDFSFTPVLDIDRGPSEVIGDRAFHHEPNVVSELAISYTNGLKLAGMAAVGKHFPGHGSVATDSHIALPQDRRSEQEILADLIPYQSLIQSNLMYGVMMAHICYPNVDPDIASFSERWMQTILRKQFLFEGVIFSDDLNMTGAESAGEIIDRGRIALDRGADMILVCNNRSAAEILITSLEGYKNPTAQERLKRMQNSAKPSAKVKFGNKAWKVLKEEIENFCKSND
ncbi:MAG: beta-N-acetylhexosaminidase [Pseudomonadota bacterium]|nr:beta-N-acetylhexosaminidase [Pseudomonadota bacterium]